MQERVKWYKVWLTLSRSWFAFAVAMTILAAFWYFCYWLVSNYAGSYLVYFRVGAWVAVISGALMLILNEPLVVLSLRAKKIRNRTECPKVWDAVNKTLPWYGRPKPRIYLTADDGMNAFAFGWGLPFLSAVGATRGIVEKLSDEELQGVMAHEMSHITHKDILVSMAMTITVMMMLFTGWLLLRVGPYNRGSRSSKSKGSGAAALLVIILVGFLLYGVGRLLGVFLQMFVSRQREYAADAGSARIMGSSRPLISALKKIVSNPEISGSRTANAAIGFLCTADPDPSDLMSTHPSVDKRITALQMLEG